VLGKSGGNSASRYRKNPTNDLAALNNASPEDWMGEARRGGPQRGRLEDLARYRKFGVELKAVAEQLREESELAESGFGQEALFRKYSDLMAAEQQFV